MSNLEKVKEFHKAFNHSVNTFVTDKELKLRATLITEEFHEVIQELTPEGGPENLDRKSLSKELCDLLYVVYGTAVSFGIELDQVFDEVHSSNMSKLGDDGKPILREDGKILKSKNYKEPNLDKIFS